jgi:hypothetical protein
VQTSQIVEFPRVWFINGVVGLSCFQVKTLIQFQFERAVALHAAL